MHMYSEFFGHKLCYMIILFLFDKSGSIIKLDTALSTFLIQEVGWSFSKGLTKP